MITNFFNEYNYNIIINFKKSITQTSRFINFYLSKKINHLNLDNIEFTFLEINQYLLNLSKIKFYKIKRWAYYRCFPGQERHSQFHH